MTKLPTLPPQIPWKADLTWQDCKAQELTCVPSGRRRSRRSPSHKGRPVCQRAVALRRDVPSTEPSLASSEFFAEQQNVFACYALFCAASASPFPPNFFRIAESIFSANVCCCRERKRTYKAAVNTSAGTASSRAACIVHRPSPDSSTTP